MKITRSNRVPMTNKQYRSYVEKKWLSIFKRRYQAPRHTRAERCKLYPLKINDKDVIIRHVGTVGELLAALTGLDPDTSVVVQVNGDFILQEIIAIEVKQVWVGGLFIDPDASCVLNVSIV